MIDIPMPLPPGALCDRPADLLHEGLDGSGAFWWEGTGLTADKAGSVTGWAPRLGPRIAVPTPPAQANATIGEAGDLLGLQGRANTHCGLMVEDCIADAQTVSVAVRYLPPPREAAKTLVTVNAGGGAAKNYLFISETDGVVHVQDNRGLVDLTLTAPPVDDLRTIAVGLSPTGIRAENLGGEVAQAPATAPVLQGAASLYIGCRNHRSGLLKTLGGALITDVWLWPGRDIWAGDARALTALRRHHLWSEGGL